jgi:type I restriction enzyme M protein
MLDARKIYRKVTQKINDFSTEQHQNINAIVQMYRGDNAPFSIALKEYIYKAVDLIDKCEETRIQLNLGLAKLYINLLQWQNDTTLTKDQQKTIDKLKFAEPLANYSNSVTKFDESCKNNFDKIDSQNDKAFNEYSKAQKSNKTTPTLKNNVLETLNELVKHFDKTAKDYKQIINESNTLLNLCEKDFKTINAKGFRELELNTISKQIEALYKVFNDTLHKFKYQLKNAEWLHHRFENGVYNDVEGLCKIVENTEVAEKEYSLTAGRYVGVTNEIDADFDYEMRLGEIKIELNGLNDEAIGLANLIQTNLEEIGI